MSDRLLCFDSLEKEGTGATFSDINVIMVLWLFSSELSADYVSEYFRQLSFS